MGHQTLTTGLVVTATYDLAEEHLSPAQVTEYLAERRRELLAAIKAVCPQASVEILDPYTPPDYVGSWKKR